MFLRDLFRLVPAEYCLFIEPNSVSFLRLSFRKVEILLQRNISGSHGNNQFQLIFQSLRDSGVYYGQPTVAILDTEQGYSYYKRFGTAGAAQFYETVRMIQSDTLELRTGVLKGKSGRIFAAQAAEKGVISELTAASDEAAVNVTHLVTLSSACVAGALDRQAGKNYISVYHLPTGNVTYLAEDKRGSILFGTVPLADKPQTVSEITSELRTSLMEPAEEVNVTVPVDSGDATSGSGESPPATCMHNLLKKVGKLKGLDFRPAPPRMAVILKTTLNSARLLILVLGSVLMLMLLSAGVTGLMSAGEGESIDTYQTYYNSKLSLENERDAAMAAERALLSGRIESRNVSAVLSAFCQKSYPSVYLTRIYLTDPSSDSTQVEITGTARDERAVFQYHDAVSQYVRPHSLSLSSIKPDIRNLRGAVDTTLNFKLTMVINE